MYIYAKSTRACAYVVQCVRGRYLVNFSYYRACKVFGGTDRSIVFATLIGNPRGPRVSKMEFNLWIQISLYCWNDIQKLISPVTSDDETQNITSNAFVKYRRNAREIRESVKIVKQFHVRKLVA